MLKVAKKMLPQLQRDFRPQDDDPDEARENLLGGGGESSLSSVAGVVAQEEVARLRRLVFRATKGKSYMHIESYTVDESDDEEDEKPEVKAVYIIMFLDGQQIRDRLKKICESFHGERFDIPSEQADFATALKGIEKSINDSQDVVDRSRANLF